MLSYILLKSIIIGFSIAAPVGPIGLLCINRTLHYGFKSGFFSGFGAALADGLYGSIAAFGLTFISQQLIEHQYWIKIIGGIFLLYLGIKTFLATPAKNAAISPIHASNIQNFITTFFLTLTNPLTILSFIGIFAGLGLGTEHIHYIESALLVTGVIIGSLIWWVVLSFIVAKIFRSKFSSTANSLINKFSGATIALFGLLAIYSSLAGIPL